MLEIIYSNPWRAWHIYFSTIRVTICFSSELRSNIFIVSRSTDLGQKLECINTPPHITQSYAYSHGTVFVLFFAKPCGSRIWCKNMDQLYLVELVEALQARLFVGGGRFPYFVGPRGQKFLKIQVFQVLSVPVGMFLFILLF